MKLIELLDVMKETENILVIDGEGCSLYYGIVANVTFSVWHNKYVEQIERYSDGGSMYIRIKVKYGKTKV